MKEKGIVAQVNREARISIVVRRALRSDFRQTTPPNAASVLLQRRDQPLKGKQSSHVSLGLPARCCQRAWSPPRGSYDAIQSAEGAVGASRHRHREPRPAGQRVQGRKATGRAPGGTGTPETDRRPDGRVHAASSAARAGRAADCRRGRKSRSSSSWRPRGNSHAIAEQSARSWRASRWLTGWAARLNCPTPTGQNFEGVASSVETANSAVFWAAIVGVGCLSQRRGLKRL